MKPSLSSHNLLALMKNNHVRILDVRGQDEFNRGHIFGAVNIPVDELPNRHGEVLSDKVIVTYCGKGAGRSERAAKALIENGKNAFWLEGGYLDWPLNSPNSPQKEEQMIFHQLFEKESSSYTYLLADPLTREAIIIDPVLETVDRDLKLIQELDLNLLYILETHIHADHITGSSEIKKRTGAKSAVSKKAGVCCADLEIEENHEIKFGRYTLKVLETPGHTDESLSFLCEKMIFTGDSLMIRGTGRTDFQNGSADVLYESIHKKIFALPDDTKVYPAHDYKGILFSTVQCEKEFNPRLGTGKTKDEFITMMKDLKLADPKKIHEAVPANLACGKIPSQVNP
jgi:glyoxylase-like metal-dependent hydrolase (beta-lactamase superfamily II)/rhodanese-related sulfurtransferase